MLPIALIVAFYILVLTILARALRAKLLHGFPLFYSYIIFTLITQIIVDGFYLWGSVYHARVFWFRFMINLLAEFAVLVEISDHIFNPYPAIRRLGRVLTLCITTTFFVLYILPPLGENQPTDLAILGLVKRASLTKAVIIIILLAAVRYYRLPLSRNISGIMLGFSAYLGINVVNSLALERYGAAMYDATFSIIGPMSYGLCLLIWTIALWRFEPELPAPREFVHGDQGDLVSLGSQIDRFNTTLARLLRR